MIAFHVKTNWNDIYYEESAHSTVKGYDKITFPTNNISRVEIGYLRCKACTEIHNRVTVKEPLRITPIRVEGK
jgi:hypothetical protein